MDCLRVGHFQTGFGSYFETKFLNYEVTCMYTVNTPLSKQTLTAGLCANAQLLSRDLYQPTSSSPCIQ